MNPIARGADFVDSRTHPRNYQLFLLSLFLLLTLGAFLASATPDLVRVNGLQMPPLCLFKLGTGLECPACGITRSLILAFHGLWKEAYLTHIWGLPLALLVVLQIPYRAYLAFGGNPVLLPHAWRVWTLRFVFLSLLLPWIVKTTLVTLARLQP